MLNIHPSILPLFPGLDTHARCLAAGMAVHGCTVHEVTPELDAGPILGQAVIAVAAGDTPETLAARLLPLEHRLYPAVLRRFAAATGQGGALPVSRPVSCAAQPRAALGRDLRPRRHPLGRGADRARCRRRLPAAARGRGAAALRRLLGPGAWRSQDRHWRDCDGDEKAALRAPLRGAEGGGRDAMGRLGARGRARPVRRPDQPTSSRPEKK